MPEEIKTPATESAPVAEQAPAPKAQNKKLLYIGGAVVALLILVAIASQTVPGVGSFLGVNKNQQAADAIEAAARQSGQNVNVDANDDSVTITDSEGSKTTYSTGDTGKLEKDFPKEVPIYSGNVKGSASVENDGSKQWVVTVTTEDSLDKVAAKLKTSFSSNGWTLESQFESTDNGLYTASNSNYEASVAIEKEDGKVLISYSVGQVTADTSSEDRAPDEQ